MARLSCCLLPCARRSAVEAVWAEKETRGEDGGKAQVQFGHRSEHYKKPNAEGPALNVHKCNSHLCPACHPATASVRFIKVAELKTSPKRSLEHPRALTKTPTLPCKKQLIIENMSSIGNIRAYSTINQNQCQINPTESLSDDESVLKFIESIEGGLRGYF